MPYILDKIESPFLKELPTTCNCRKALIMSLTYVIIDIQWYTKTHHIAYPKPYSGQGRVNRYTIKKEYKQVKAITK